MLYKQRPLVFLFLYPRRLEMKNKYLKLRDCIGGWAMELCDRVNTQRERRRGDEDVGIHRVSRTTADAAGS